MATTKERIVFLNGTIKVLLDTQNQTKKLHSDIVDAAKKINVSSVYKIANSIGEIAESVNETSIFTCDKVKEIMDLYLKNDFNAGEYKDLAKQTANVAENEKPSRLSIDKLSLNSNAEENISAANVNEFNDSLIKLGSIARNNLLELSAKAKGLKQDDSDLAINIGRNIETLTNSIVRVTNNISSQVADMAREYSLELHKLDDISAQFSSVEGVNDNVDIKVSQGEY